MNYQSCPKPRKLVLEPSSSGVILTLIPVLFLDFPRGAPTPVGVGGGAPSYDMAKVLPKIGPGAGIPSFPYPLRICHLILLLQNANFNSAFIRSVKYA